jgi:hypothetical protein
MPPGGFVNKTDQYRAKLKMLKDWDEFLLKESGLPGPRGNIELAQVVADEGDVALYTRYITFDAARAPTNSPYEFLAFCGVVGLGRLVAEGQAQHLATLRACASDPRWRIREGVAMALQRVGDRDMDLLLREMKRWSAGNMLEQRAAAAALCEPRLLRNHKQIEQVFLILDKITASVARVENRKSDEFIALKKGLGYCWSVAVAALPAIGKKKMEKWFASKDRDIIWVMRENLKKNRLARADSSWVTKWQAQLKK